MLRGRPCFRVPGRKPRPRFLRAQPRGRRAGAHAAAASRPHGRLVQWSQLRGCVAASIATTRPVWPFASGPWRMARTYSYERAGVHSGHRRGGATARKLHATLRRRVSARLRLQGLGQPVKAGCPSLAVVIDAMQFRVYEFSNPFFTSTGPGVQAWRPRRPPPRTVCRSGKAKPAADASAACGGSHRPMCSGLGMGARLGLGERLQQRITQRITPLASSKLTHHAARVNVQRATYTALKFKLSAPLRKRNLRLSPDEFGNSTATVV